jgi:hypothetical protein
MTEWDASDSCGSFSSRDHPFAAPVPHLWGISLSPTVIGLLCRRLAVKLFTWCSASVHLKHAHL